MKLAVNLWQIVLNSSRNVLPLLLSLFILTNAAAAAAANNASAPAGVSVENSLSSANTIVPSAVFKRLWIDYDVTQGGRKGMRIHTNFEVYNMRGIDGYLGLYFMYRDGTAIRDKNGQFDTSDGNVAVYEPIFPNSNTMVYRDLPIFMPYDELDLPDGDYKLSVRANVIYKEGGNIQNGLLTTYDFVYTQGAPVKKDPTATFNRLWVDYDVTEGNQRGMRVHVNFQIADAIGIRPRLAVYFQKKNGEKLYTTNRTYRSMDKDRVGQIVAYFDLTPGYEITDYDDISVFMPYSVLNLPRGNHDLAIDVDLVYPNGNLIQHLELHEFWFEK